MMVLLYTETVSTAPSFYCHHKRK